MVYLFGLCGLVLGFGVGMFVIHLFLQNYRSHELIKDKSLRWTYGLAVWLIAGLCAWLGVWLYERSIF